VFSAIADLRAYNGFMKILHVVGARPNFMKVAPVIAALRGRLEVQQILVHTGQHYDLNMSDVFFQQLGLPEPDVNVEIGSGSHAWQTAQIMMRLEPVLIEHKPDLVLVYGDVNSTVASTLVSAKLLMPVGHVEAGLRSFDRTMPEEINRLLTDQMADLLFTPSSDANDNLRREGIPAERIYLVGNVMIDTLIRLLPMTEKSWPSLQERMGLDRYGLVTLHRPSNVDDPEMLSQIITALIEISRSLPLVFAIHPRTRQRLVDFQLTFPQEDGFLLVDPLGYLDFLALESHATVVITDSGGIQEETTYLDVPCLTIRENTERPITVTMGTNTLVGQDMQRLIREVQTILKGGGKKGKIPPLWDGHAAERIADVVLRGG
jgi:UDP-N-acetylglucosamine 2-epimerase (non-hydrolysing)